MGRYLKFIFILTVTILLVGLCIYLGLIICGRQAFTDTVMYESECLAERGSKAIFLIEGLQDRGLHLIVRDRGKTPKETQELGDLEWQTRFNFEHAKWTKDGLAIVVRMLAFDRDEMIDVYGYAYDFGDGKALCPPNIGNTTKSEWEILSKKIEETVIRHGGLATNEISHETISKHGKNIWFWQIPK